MLNGQLSPKEHEKDPGGWGQCPGYRHCSILAGAPLSWMRAPLASVLVFAAICSTGCSQRVDTPAEVPPSAEKLPKSTAEESPSATRTVASDFFLNESWLRDDGTAIVGPFVRVEPRTIDVIDMSDGPKSSMRPITIQRIKQTPQQQDRISEFENRLEKLRRGVPTSQKVNVDYRVEEVPETNDDLAVQRFIPLKLESPLGIYCTRTRNGLMYAAGETRDGAPDGLFVCYFPDGRWRFIDLIVDGHKLIRQVYHKNGRIAKVATFKAGVTHGVITSWYDDGQIAVISEYQDGKPHRGTVMYLPNGKTAESYDFNQGVQVNYKAYVKDDRDFKPIEDLNNETSQEAFKKVWQAAAN